MKIRALDEIRHLPSPNLLPKDKTMAGAKLKFVQKLKLIFYIIFFIPVGIYFIVKIIWGIKRSKTTSELASDTYEETTYQPNAALQYDSDTQTLEIKLDNRGLIIFLRTIEDAYKNDKGIEMGSLSGKLSIQKEGWHSHSSFWWSDSNHELTIGTGESDRLRITAGEWITANSDAWLRFAAEITRFKNEKASIVLDASDEDWCTPDSTGRIIFHFGSL